MSKHVGNKMVRRADITIQLPIKGKGKATYGIDLQYGGRWSKECKSCAHEGHYSKSGWIDAYDLPSIDVARRILISLIEILGLKMGKKRIRILRPRGEK